MAEQGTVEVDSQLVAFEWLEIDLRTDEQRQADAASGHLAGDPVVVLPGHGQTSASPRKLTAAAVALSGAGVGWCIHIFTPVGGDPVKARALSLIVMERLAALFPAMHRTGGSQTQPCRVTLIGWSHGVSEALRSAEVDPALFPRVAGLCPTGLIERRSLELLLSFDFEVMRIVWTALVRRDWASLRDGTRVGIDILRGIWQDLIRSRSLNRVLDDIRWAGRKVPGPGFGYGGDIAMVFARDDTVIRWQAVFPECAAPEGIPAHLEAYRRTNFPNAARLQVAVLEGDHLSPEGAAATYAHAAFGMLGLVDYSSAK